jgi:hypothetical protein
MFITPRLSRLIVHSDVHNIHPRHAFLVVPDQLSRSKSEPDLTAAAGADSIDEPCTFFHKSFYGGLELTECGMRCSVEAPRCFVSPVRVPANQS